MYCNKPTVFKQTDFPPAFGPEIISILFFSFSLNDNGTTDLFCFFSDNSRRGCTAFSHSRQAWFSNTGKTELKSCDNLALLFRKSISAKSR